MVVSSSIDTTCTVWNLDAQAAVTQLIAHDREVYDVAWLPNSTDIFVSVGADGSLRAFDLRSLEHSTILYETPTPKPNSANAVNAAAAGRPRTAPLLKIAFNPADSNYMATFHMESSDVQILDMRSPGQPVMELRGHRAQVNALGWGMGDQPLLATAGQHSYFVPLLSLFVLTSSPQLTIVKSSFGISTPKWLRHTPLLTHSGALVGVIGSQLLPLVLMRRKSGFSLPIRYWPTRLNLRSIICAGAHRLRV